MELEKLIEAERERCACLVEGYRPKCIGLEESILVRIINQIRGVLLPEPFGEQIVSEETTAYATSETVEEERGRCLTCVLMHSVEGSTSRLGAMLREIANSISAGPS